jgi:HrpA-like RNA helicase
VVGDAWWVMGDAWWVVLINGEMGCGKSTQVRTPMRHELRIVA